MTFRKSDLTVTAFQMAGPIYQGARRYRAGCWLVHGWYEGEQAVMTPQQFLTMFGRRRGMR